MKVILIRCKCGKVKRYGEWIRPTGKDLELIEQNYNNITWQYEQCDVCRIRKEGSK